MRRLGTPCLLMAAALGIGVAGCRAPVSEEAAEPATTPEPGVVEVRAEDYSFTAPPSFPSGWVKLRFHNAGAEPHFMFMLDLPDGVTFDDYAADVAQPFGELYAKYRAGELEQAAFLEQLGAAVPEWFMTAPRVGGAGFTSPGETSETMIHLQPGDNYTIECYVRTMTAGDTFHGDHGMLRPLIVGDEPTGLEPPASDIDIRLSNYDIAVDGDLTAGRHIVRVRVEEDPEGLIRHNVHLARLEDEPATAVALWMNWVDELMPPAPARFLGGAGQMSAGGESYLDIDLTPGRYAWISETYGPQGMIHEFTVE